MKTVKTIPTQISSTLSDLLEVVSTMRKEIQELDAGQPLPQLATKEPDRPTAAN